MICKEKIMEKKRLHYIDGYKGFLCFMIMLGHFWRIYRSTSGASPLAHPALDSILGTTTDTFTLAATFWLYAFLVISGYLLSFGKTKTFPELLTKTVSRFLRLFIPILGACLIIFGIYKAVGFYNNATADYFKNKWFQSFYRKDFVFADVFTESFNAMFAASCDFNPPFWVIRDMLLSSVLIYICQLTDTIFTKKTHVLPLLFTLCAILLYNPVLTACLVGFLIGYYRESFSRLAENFWSFLAISLVIYSVFLWMKAEKVFPTSFGRTATFTLLHCFLLLLLNRFTALQRFFSTKFFLLSGKISFGVYSFHWPLICSVGSLLLLLGIRQQWPPVLAFFTPLLVSIPCTVVLSIVYHFTVEKLSDFIVGWVKKAGSYLNQKVTPTI